MAYFLCKSVAKKVIMVNHYQDSTFAMHANHFTKQIRKFLNHKVIL